MVTAVIPGFAGSEENGYAKLNSGTSAVVVVKSNMSKSEEQSTGFIEAITRILMALKLFAATGNTDFLLNSGPDDGVFLIKVAGGNGNQKPQTQKVVVQK